MYKKTLFTAFLLLGFSVCRAQTDWKLRSERDSIRIFTAHVPGSNIKAIKVDCVLPGTLSQMVAVILDINATGDWIYNTKSCTVLKQVSPSELFYYSEIDFPWPASNRDFVAHIKVTQDPHSKIVTVDAFNLSELVPVKPGIVRVTESVGKWTISPVEKNSIRIEYVLRVDPAGSLPAWLVNLFSTKGPFETFKKLRTHLQKPDYRKARFSFIAD